MRNLCLATVVTVFATTSVSAQQPERESALGSTLRDYGVFVGLDTRVW
jgi:hypothetical protein